MNRWDRMQPYEWRRLEDKKLKQYLQHEVLPYHAFYRERAKALGIHLADITSVEKFQQYPELITQKADIVGRDKEFVLQPTLSRMLRHDPAKVFGMFLRATNVQRNFRRNHEAIGFRDALRRVVEMEYRDVRRTYTTGRSSARTGFVFTNYDLDPENGFVSIAARRAFQLLGVPQGAYAMSVFPAALHLAHLFVVEGARGVPAPVDPLLGLSTIQRVEAIERLKPVALFGVPSYMVRLFELAAGEKRDYSSLIRVVCGGEGISEAQRTHMRELLSAMGSPDPVIVSSYGFTEARMAFIECAEGARQGLNVGYHIYPDLVVIETARIIEDTDGFIKTVLPCEPMEEGEILATLLHGHGSAVLRWRTKDFARLTEQPCPACGRSLPRIIGPIRRHSKDMVKKVKSTLVDFDNVIRLFNDNACLRAWQIVLGYSHGQDCVTVFVSLSENINSVEVAARLRNAFKAETEISIDEIVTESYEQLIRRLGTDTELKERRIVDLRTEA